jgi:hypothetical protein
MPEDWQFYFRVKGLIAPEQGMLLDNGNLLLRGVKDEMQETHVFLRATVEATGKEEADKQMHEKWREAESLLNKLLKIYVLTTGGYVEIFPGKSASKIQQDNPFGHPKAEVTMVGRLRALVSAEEIKRYTDLLNQAMKNFDLWKSVFSDEKKSYLRNALDYLYHATGDERIEEKLIDLMVSMESLFGGGQEIRLRISLRAAYLLSAGRESERPQIFRRIYDLYDKRSKIVHGGEKVPLTYEEVYELEHFVQESIMDLITLNLSKEEIVALLDESVYDEDKRKEIVHLISRARVT